MIAQSQLRRRKLSLAARLESLETRTLLSAITNYQIEDYIAPVSSAVDNHGDLWVGNQNAGIQKVHKNADGSLAVTDFDAAFGATSVVYDAVSGNIFANDYAGAIEEINPTDGSLINTFTVDNPNTPYETAQYLAAATDGAIWFTTPGTTANDPNQTVTSDIGRLNVTTGHITFAQVPATNTQPTTIKAAADGTVWFANGGTDNPVTNGVSSLGHGSTNSSGGITLAIYDVPNNGGVVFDVAVAPDNTLWYTIGTDTNPGSQARPQVADAVCHATLQGSTLKVTSYTLPKAAGEGEVNPGHIAVDASGGVWFSDFDKIDYLDSSTGELTRMNPENDGAVRSSLSISDTDVWILSNGGATDLADISLADFSASITATTPDFNAGVGQTFSGPVALFASDEPGNFTYTIDYGNGTTATGTVANNGGTGPYTINGNTTYTATGSYATRVTITTDSGDVSVVNGHATVSSTVTIPLVSQGVNLQAQRGVAIAPNVSGAALPVVAQFSGPAASYTATINWGDSTSTVGQIVSLGNNQYYVEIPSGSSKSYATPGTYNVSVVITAGANSTTATSTATISAVPVVASQNLVLQPLLGGLVLTTVGTFTADSASTANWFKATINWGDGTHSTGLVVRTSAGHYTIIGLHLYTKKGTYSVTTGIVDSVDVESATATATIKIK